MEIISLNQNWKIYQEGETEYTSIDIPGSIYSAYLSAGKMQDPFYRDQETAARHLADNNFIFENDFYFHHEEHPYTNHILKFYGLDTLADVYLNGIFLGHADNMHRTWKFNINQAIKEGLNHISVHFFSPVRYAHDKNDKYPVIGPVDCTKGFAHLRKAHSMMGWDWGPRLPDMGIWRKVELVCLNRVTLESVKIHQEHQDGKVILSFDPDLDLYESQATPSVKVIVTSPDGQTFESDGSPIIIHHPLLWWPNGFGEQPLYNVSVTLLDGEEETGHWQRKIGLRTLTIERIKDEQGESFTTVVNGIRIFAMGGDYIPEDNILQRMNADRTKHLIEDCKLANYNTIRVWGGGFYPDDWFYDACDEAGIMVWQDFMFACALYPLCGDMEDNIRNEILDNVRRIRHHASLCLWCGNNETEWLACRPDWQLPTLQSDYIKLFEYIIPKILNKEDPDTFYWPSSPSCGGGMDDPNAPNRGDTHYWEVWHGNKPFTEYRKFKFRYASEFGFQSFPCMKTIETFTEPRDRNIFSYVMERHQRNSTANGKIMNYLAQTFLYPSNLDTLVYASQLLQAEAIRYGVEHWRRNRGCCMGSLYWQINDCWPVASWASIDYYGRWKALHYAAKRFYAPVLLSCQEEGTLTQTASVNDENESYEKSAILNISNETILDQNCVITWSLRNPSGTILQQGSINCMVPALSAKWLGKMDFSDCDPHTSYLSYDLWTNEKHVSHGSTLFCPPKHFLFENPHLTLVEKDEEIIIRSDTYARAVEISCEDGDPVFSDNYFDMDPGEKRIKIIQGHGTKFKIRSVWDIQ